MGNSSSEVATVQSGLTTAQSDLTILKSNLANYLKQADAINQFLAKSDSTAFAKMDQLKDYVKATDLDTKLTGYLKNDTLKDVDIDKMAGLLATNSAFVNTVSSSLTSSSPLLAAKVAPLLVKDVAFSSTIANSLQTSGDFLKNMANTLTTDATYKTRITGPKGETGSIANIDANVGTRTLWCAADGSVCNLPQFKNAQGVMNTTPITGAAKFANNVQVAGTLGLGDDAGSGKFNLVPGSDQWLQLVNKSGAYGDLGLVATNGWFKNMKLDADGKMTMGKFNLVPGTDAWLRLRDASGQYGGLGIVAEKGWFSNVTVDAGGSVAVGAAGSVGIGDWKIYEDGQALCFKKGTGDVMCLNNGNDLIQVYKDKERKMPYWAYTNSHFAGKNPP